LGITSDDSHDNQEDDSNKGWIVVNSNKCPLENEDIIKNIKAINFYSVVYKDNVIGRHPFNQD